MSLRTRKLIGDLDIAREDGKFAESLEMAVDATLVAQEEGNILGMAEIQSANVITYRHLADKTGDKHFLILAKYAAMSAVEMAEKSGQKDALAIPYYGLAKAHESLAELQKAKSWYEKAAEAFQANPPEPHNRAGVLADMKIHLHTVEAELGDDSAIDRLKKSLQDLTDSNEKDYTRNVWISGAHMNLARLLKDKNPEEAKEHLQEAKDIIDSDKRMSLRRAQWEKLARSF